jgi:riboflavin synthase
MYTGVVQEVGEIRAVERLSSGYRVDINTDTTSLSFGDSIGINGVCLTAEAVGDGRIDAVLSSETVERTYLGDLHSGDSVNIERPVSPDGQLDGHVVKGTVDTMTEIDDIEDLGEDWQFTFALPDGYEQYLAEKGAVALDGVSLTVTDITNETFSVAVVPATYYGTTLSEKSVGDSVHFEADILAKYVERQRTFESGVNA